MNILVAKKGKIKICHMTSVHAPEDVRIFHKECVSLAQAGYEVYLVERGETYDKNGVHIVGVGEMPKSRWKRMTEGTKRVYQKALALDCDIYHLHDPELLPYARKLKRKGKKVVFDSHELTKEQIRGKKYIPGWAIAAVANAYGRYEEHILRQIDGVIFPCLIKGQFPLAGKRKVLLNNVPRLSEFYYKYDSSIQKRERSLCMVGTVSKSRGITALVQAACLANSSVYIAGKANEVGYIEKLMQMPEAKSLHYLGIINRDQVCQLIQESEIGIAALLNEGQYGILNNLPTKAYEYMSMGIPVILTKTPYNEQMVRQYNFGICVDPENTNEYAKAIQNLLDDHKKAKEMGSNGRKLIAERLNWEKEFETLNALYQDILSE